MEADILLDLINRGIVRTGTEVTIIRRGQDLAGERRVPTEQCLEVRSHAEVDGEIVLEAFSTLDGKTFNVKAKNIIKIDGMYLSRLLNAHQSEGKKRGRKPKRKK